MTNPTKDKRKDWEKEFDDMWSELEETVVFGEGTPGIASWEDEKVKHFISSLLKQQKQELKEKMGKMKLINDKNNAPWGIKADHYNQALDDILKLL